MTAPIRFCFDFLSPYAYLAWTRIHGIARWAGREIEPWPVVFGAMLDAHGTRGPAEVPAKRRYLVKDIARIADVYGVPIAPPFALPFRSLHALRIASLPIEREPRRALIDALYAGAWARSLDLTDRAVLARIVTDVGLDASLVDRAEDPENKERLRRQTEEAVAAGAFGVPTAIVDGEIFWGTDSLPHLERFLAGQDPVDPRVIAAFDAVPVGARRKA